MNLLPFVSFLILILIGGISYNNYRKVSESRTALSIAFFTSIFVLSWSALVGFLLSKYRITYINIIPYQVGVGALAVLLLRPSNRARIHTQLPGISRQNILIAAVSTFGLWLATAPDFLPAWANIDFAQHVAMVENLSRSLLGDEKSIQNMRHFFDSYPYIFGIHLYVAFMKNLLQISTLSIIHGVVCVAFGVLLLGMLELARDCHGVLKGFLVVTAFSSPVFDDFIRAGWLPHLWGTGLTLFLMSRLPNILVIRSYSLRIGSFIEIMALYLAFAAYPFCAIALFISIFFDRLSSHQISPRFTWILGVGGAAVVIPCIFMPSIWQNLVALYGRYILGQETQLYHALRVGSGHSLVSPWEWIAFAGLGIFAVFTRRDPASNAYLSHLAVLVVFSSVMSPGAYLIDKTLHSTAPIFIVMLCRLANTFLNHNVWKSHFSWPRLMLSSVSFAMIFWIWFHPSLNALKNKSEAFLNRDEFEAVKELTDWYGHGQAFDIAFVGMTGAKQFLIRQILERDVWSGPFIVEDYIIKGRLSLNDFRKTIQQKVFNGERILIWREDHADEDQKSFGEWNFEPFRKGRGFTIYQATKIN